MVFMPETRGLIAHANTAIDAPTSRVWEALTSPELIKQYMFGTEAVSEWREGSPIVWKGELRGRRYEDKGVILRMEKERLISYSHFSPLSGKEDLPDNYHTVTIEISAEGRQTRVTLSQDNNSTEEDRRHSEENWRMMLENMKKLLENKKENG